MGVLEKLSAKFCVQTAVYWGSPENDGRGKKTFADPIDIKVTWSEKGELVTDKNGKEVQAQITCLVLQDLDYEGQMCLSSVAELEAVYSDISNPYDIDNTFEIISKTKIPMVFKTDDFVRTVYLGKKDN